MSIDLQEHYRAQARITAMEGVLAMLRYIGEDPARDGLLETPDRVVRSWTEMFSGYKVDVPGLFKTFESGGYDQMVVLKDVEFVSFCEHHLLPFQGVAHIGYLPSDRIVGLSKLARVVDAYARRLQVQERMTADIGNAMVKGLNANGVAVVVEAHHQCMSCRGVRKANAKMVTSFLVGPFEREVACRAEFFNLIRG